MTPADLTAAREALGLTAAALGRALELEGRDPGQQVKRWETGKAAIPGPVRVAMRYLLALAREGEALERAKPQASQKPQEAPKPISAPTLAPEPVPPVLAPSESHGGPIAPKTNRRRG